MGDGPFGAGSRPARVRRGGDRVQQPGCCSYVEAGKALGGLRFRLAARYIRMDVKARMGLI